MKDILFCSACYQCACKICIIHSSFHLGNGLFISHGVSYIRKEEYKGENKTLKKITSKVEVCATASW